MKRKIKIFDYAWHVPHQYDMMHALRDECEFYYCLNIKKQWDLSQRPLPDNLNFVTHYEKGRYDVAILHIDQQIVIADHVKRMIYDQFDELITDIPKIVINHGTPVFPEGMLYLGYHLSNTEMEQKCTELVRKIVGDNVMVVNSYTAASDKEWGFGVPIVHGMNPVDWFDLPKEPRAFTAMSPFGFETYYNRECMMNVSESLYHKYGYTLAYAKLNINTHQSVQAYKEYLGQSLLYIDTSFRTPMNRARTEAFLSGCCVIQVDGAHDLERWAKNGENILLVPNDADVIAATIADMLENRYHEALRIGQAAKAMAMNEFSPARYRQNWLHLLDKIVN